MNPSTFSRLRASAAKSPITPLCQVSTKFARAFLALAAALLVGATNSPAASAQTVTYAGSGAVNFGSVNVCPVGKTTPAPCSQTLTLTYNVTASGTLGTPKALTTGVPNLDYTIASGSTCSGSVTQGNTCKVNVTFAPTAPGQRKGAVEIVDASNNVLATNYIYGSGLGPIIGYASGSVTTRSIGPLAATYLYEAIVDAAGDAFVVSAAPNGREIEEMFAVNGVLPANPATKLIPKYAIGPIAIDGAGNLFSYSPDEVIEILAAGDYSTEASVGSGYTQISGIALDASGNLFVSDVGNPPAISPSVKEFLAADGYTTSKTLGNGYSFASPGKLALDGSGNVYVTEASTIEEVLAAGGYAAVRVITPPSSYGPNTIAIAIDPAGDLFVNSVEYAAVDGVVPLHPTAIVTGVGSDFPIALEPNGNLLTIYEGCLINCGYDHTQGYRPNDVTDGYGVIELQLTTPTPLTFASTIVGSTSAPQTIKIQDRGTADLDLTALSVLGPNWSQIHGDGTSPDCAASSSLVSGALCNLSISFEPVELGALTSTVTVTDNTFNVPGSSQSTSLSGTGVAALPQITSLSNYYAAPYSVVILHGTGFGATQGSSTVTFNGIPTPHYYWADTQIYVTVPPNATTGDVVVTVKGDASNSIYFTVVPQPAVTGISPTSGPGNTIVTIKGRNLLDLEGKQTITVNGQSLPIIGASNTAFSVAIPASYPDGSYRFHVLTNDTGIDTPAFTVAPPSQPVTGPPSTSFGSVNVCPAGKTVPAPCSQTLTLTYTANANITLGTPRALTTGQPNLDYKLATGSTCTGSVSAGNTCTVKVTFAPIAPGARNGAVEIVDTSGNVLTATYISGTGIGPLISFGPPVASTLNAGLSQNPAGMAVDASGNVFLADAGGASGSIRELLAVNGSLPPNPVVNFLPIGSGHSPVSIAVDGAGNVFYTDGASSVTEVLSANNYTTSRIILTGVTFFTGLAVDGSGNVFAAYRGGTNVDGNVKEIFAASGYTTTKTIEVAPHDQNPQSIALDANGNLFILSYAFPDGSTGGTVNEYLASGGYTTVKTISNPISPGGLFAATIFAVDPAENLFIAFSNNIVSFTGELFAVNGVVPQNPAYLIFDNVSGTALDQRGNLYGEGFDAQNHLVVQELQFTALPSLAFETVSVGNTSSDSPQSISIQNQGNASLDVSDLAISTNWDQVSGSGTPADCAANFSLAGGAVCNLSISFKPTQTGALTGAVTLKDDSLNLPGTTASGALSGTGIAGPPPPHIAAVSTTYAAAFSSVTLTGTNFGATEGSSTITFSGVAGHATAWSNTKIVVTVPKVPTYGPGELLVTVAGELSNAVAFAVEPQPAIYFLNPASGPVGSVVDIYGGNLIDAGNEGTVTFNGKSLPFTTGSGTEDTIEVTIPTGAVTGAFTVFVNNTTLTSPIFTVTK